MSESEKSRLPKITNLKVETLEYDFSHTLFSGKETKDKILSLLPTMRDQRVSFCLKQATCAVANGLRRVIMTELEVKCLDFDISELDTNEEYIIPVELRDRINKIAIRQDIPDDAEFSLKVASTDATEEYALVRSRDLVQIGGKKTSAGNPWFAETHRLAELQPGKYLKIPRIYVSKGYGYADIKWSITSDVEYRCLDFITVNFINDRGNFIHKRINTDELVALMRKLKIAMPKDTDRDTLWKKRIVVIPNKNYQKKLQPRDHETIKSFDLVVENPEAWDLTDMDIDDKFLKGYSSMEANPQDFYLSIRVYNNIDPLVLLSRTCENIVSRLDSISSALESKDTASMVHVIQDDKKTQVKIKGEDHTIGQLLSTTLYELDPSATVIKTIEHPHNRVVLITMIHPQPMKWFQDALGLIKKRYLSLAAEFAKKQ